MAGRAGANSDGNGAPTRTLQRGLQVLETLAQESGDWGLALTDVAERVGLDKATTSRLLQTLCTLGYAYQERETRLYRLTGKLMSLGAYFSANLDLPRRMGPLLNELRSQSGETVHLGVLEGANADRVVYIAKLETALPVQIASAIGQTMPVHTTSLGKAIFAALPEEERDRRLAQMTLERRTAQSITDLEALRADIAHARARGYAIDDRENEEGVTCVGSALLDGKGRVVAAVSVSGPTYRVATRIHELGLLCARTSERARELV